MSKVAVVKCDSYDYKEVHNAMGKALDLIGALSLFKANEKILLKPNLLAADTPEKCSVTHFQVFRAVGQLLQGTGALLSYGDSPGINSPETAAKKSLIASAAEELGIPLADFHNGVEAINQNAVQNKKFVIAKGVMEADGLVSISKLKSHGFARMTGAIKNQFGCVPGVLKGEFHVKVPNAIEFSKMLVDLNLLLRPRLYVMDAIIAMEGNGPRSGTPRKMGMILVSTDPVALDATVCRIINLNPEYVPTITYGEEMGLGRYQESLIELVGDDIEQFKVNDFKVVREPITPYTDNRLVRIVKGVIVPKPYIAESKCVKCGICVNVCPVKEKALKFDKANMKIPQYDYKKCIRCYCCQELCPEGAIKLKKPILRKIIGK